MVAGIKIVNPSGVVQLTETRNCLCLLGKNSSPAGTIFTAQGQSDTYAFGLPQGASTYGLVIRDAAGVVLFDAVTYGKLAKPIAVMTGNIASTDTQTKTQTFASGRSYAVWLSSSVSGLRVRNVALKVGGAITYKYALDDQDVTVGVSGATVTITATREVSTMLNGGNAVPYEEAAKLDWRAVILDVTGF